MQSRPQQSLFPLVSAPIPILICAFTLVCLWVVTVDNVGAAQKTGRDVYYNNLAPIEGPWPPQLSNDNYPTQYGESRLIVWMVAQQHLYWSGLVTGSLMLVTLLEVWAMLGYRKSLAVEVDQWAYEILRVVMGGFSIAALLGVGLGTCLLVLYPDLTSYLTRIFRPTVLIYVALGLVLTLLAYGYFFTWWMWSRAGLKYLHATLGILTNAVATAIVLLANGWSSLMLSPAGVDGAGRYLGNVWHALHTATWNAFNIHRLLSHLILAAAAFACYAAHQAFRAQSDEELSQAERRGNLCLLLLTGAFFFFPFQGYWLVIELYRYNQQMGIILLGGLLAWLGQIRSLLVAGLFLGVNYYVWQRISIRTFGKSYQGFRRYVFLVLALCAAVYITPHTRVMTPKELLAVGGQQHPVLGNYGVEAAKQTAVNMMILTTIGSWYLWRRAGVVVTRNQAMWAGPITAGVFLAAAINLLLSGIYGYYVPANVRVGVLTSSAAIPFLVVGYVLLLARGWNQHTVEAPSVLRQSRLRRQWSIFLLAFLVTWLMGLGGYLRSSVRLFWHIHEVMRDQSPWSHTHSTGFAVNVISLNALLFWFGLLLLFWLAHVRGKEVTRRETASSMEVSNLEKAEIHP